MPKVQGICDIKLQIKLLLNTERTRKNNNHNEVQFKSKNRIENEFYEKIVPFQNGLTDQMNNLIITIIKLNTK